jgi:hypothetical protein
VEEAFSRIPAVADDRADRVGAAQEKAGDVVRLIFETFPVDGPAGSEIVLAHPLAVQVELIEAERRRIDARTAHGLGYGERLAEQRTLRGHRGLGDEAGGPVGGSEQPHLEEGAVAPGRLCAVDIPDADLPVVARSGSDGGAAVCDLIGLVGGDAAAVPLVAAIGVEVLPRAGHEKVIGGLPLPAPLRGELPAEARPRRVDADRIDPVLGLLRGNPDRGLGQGRRDRGQERDADGEYERPMHVDSILNSSLNWPRALVPKY